MALRSLAEYNKKNLAQEFGKYATEPWYFETWYEKVILILMGILAIWKVFGWIF